MLLKNGNIFCTETKSFVAADLEFSDTVTRIGAIGGPADFDAAGLYVVPGFVDVHTHGAMGVDASDGVAAGLPVMAAYYAAHGVTSWCPTTMTLKEPVLIPAMESIRAYTRPENGAKVAGIHLEGPFLCSAKRGAQAEDNLHAPDVAMFHRLNAASGGLVRLVTVACEEPGAMDFIEAVSKVCTVSLGHSAAGYDQAMAAYAAGASHATHLFNGMNPLHHREPGILGAAMDSGATVELICDGFHVHPAAIRLVHRLFGDKLCLISDSLRCAGMPDGDYELGGQPITVTNGLAHLSGTNTIAGSSISLLDAVRNVVKFGLPLEDAIYSATAVPAAVIRRADIGVLAPGKAADFLLLDKALNLKAVFIDGRQIQL